MLDITKTYFELDKEDEVKRLISFLGVTDAKSVSIADLTATFYYGTKSRNFSIGELFIATKKGDKTTYPKITTFEDLVKAYKNNAVYYYDTSKMYRKLDLTTAGNYLRIMPKTLQKTSSSLYLTDRYDEPGTRTIDYGVKRIMDVKGYDITNKKEIFKTIAGRGTYLYLQLQGATGWDYYPKEDLVYYEGSVEKKLKDTDFSAVDIDAWLKDHQIFYKDGSDLKLVTGMLTTKDFSMSLHRKVERESGSGKEIEQIRLADKSVVGKIVGNNIVSDSGEVVAKLDGNTVKTLTKTKTGKITTSGSKTTLKVGRNPAITVLITGVEPKTIKTKPSPGHASKVVGLIEAGVVFVKDAKGNKIRVGELNESTGEIIETTETDLGVLQADGRILDSTGKYVGEKEFKRTTDPTLEHLNIDDLTIEEFELDEFGQPKTDNNGEPTMTTRKLDGTFTEQEFKTTKGADGKNVQQMEVTTYSLVPQGKGEYIRLRVKGRNKPMLFCVKPGESKVFLGDTAIEYDVSDLEKTKNVIKSIIGQELTVEIDGKKYVTEKVTNEEAISTYSKEKVMNKSTSYEDAFGDDTYLRLADGRYVKESEFVRPIAYNFVKDDATDFDAYLYYYQVDGKWTTVILNKAELEKGTYSSIVLDKNIKTNPNLYKIKKSTKALGDSHIIQTTNANSGIEGAVTLIKKPEKTKLNASSFVAEVKDGTNTAEDDNLTKNAALTEAKRLFRDLYKQGKYDIDEVVVEGVVYKLDNVVKNEDGTISFHVSNSRYVYNNNSLVEDPTAKKPQYANMSSSPVKYDAKTGKLYGGTRYNMGKANKEYFKFWGKIWAWPTAIVLMLMGVFAMALPFMIAPALAVLAAGWVAGPIFNLVMKLKQEKKFENKAKLAREESKKKYVQELNDLYAKVLAECKAVDDEVKAYPDLDAVKNAYASHGLVWEDSIIAGVEAGKELETAKADLTSKLKAPIRTKFLDAYTKIYEGIKKGLGATHSSAAFSMKDGKVDESNAWLFSEFKEKLNAKTKELKALVKSGDLTEEEMKKQLAEFATSYEASSDEVGVDPIRVELLKKAETMKAVILLKGGLDKTEDLYEKGKTDDPTKVLLTDKQLKAVMDDNVDYKISLETQKVKEEVTVKGKTKTKKSKKEVVVGEFVEKKKVKRKGEDKETHATEIAEATKAMTRVGSNVSNVDYTDADIVMATNAHGDDILDTHTTADAEAEEKLEKAKNDAAEAVAQAQAAVTAAEKAYNDVAAIAAAIPASDANKAKAEADKKDAKDAWDAALAELGKAKDAQRAIDTHADGTDLDAEVENANNAAEEAKEQAILAEKALNRAKKRPRTLTAAEDLKLKELIDKIKEFRELFTKLYNDKGMVKRTATEPDKLKFATLRQEIIDNFDLLTLIIDKKVIYKDTTFISTNVKATDYLQAIKDLKSIIYNKTKKNVTEDKKLLAALEKLDILHLEDGRVV